MTIAPPGPWAMTSSWARVRRLGDPPHLSVDRASVSDHLNAILNGHEEEVVSLCTWAVRTVRLATFNGGELRCYRHEAKQGDASPVKEMPWMNRPLPCGRSGKVNGLSADGRGRASIYLLHLSA